MSLVIDLPRPIEARIELEAQRTGVSPAELVADVVTKNFSATADAEEQKSKPYGGIDVEEQKRLNAPTMTLLQSWLAEAAKPRTAEEIAEAEEDMLELMRSLNATRREAGERLHFPDIEEKSLAELSSSIPARWAS